MKKLLVLITASLISFSSLAATEISKSDVESKNLTKVGSISVNERTLNLCTSKVSKEADKKGAEYYVIKTVTHEGNGDSIAIISDLYSEKN